MRQVGQAVLWVGVISLVIGVFSRLTVTPVMGIKAHAFLEFTQACFLFTIAALLGSGQR